MLESIGKAKKKSGTWLLEPFGVDNFHISGKHPTTVCVGKQNNKRIYLCLTFGHVFVESPEEITYEI